MFLTPSDRHDLFFFKDANWCDTRLLVAAHVLPPTILQATGQKSYYGSLHFTPSTPHVNKVSQRSVCQPFWALPHPALFARPEVPAQNASRGPTGGEEKKKKTTQSWVSILCKVLGFITWNEKHPLLQSHSPLWRLDNEEYSKERE